MGRHAVQEQCRRSKAWWIWRKGVRDGWCEGNGDMWLVSKVYKAIGKILNEVYGIRKGRKLREATEQFEKN